MTAGGETHEAAAWSAAIFARRFDVHPARVAGRPDCNLHEPDPPAASRYDDRRCGASERGAVSQEVARARAGDAQSWSCWTRRPASRSQSCGLELSGQTVIEPFISRASQAARGSLVATGRLSSGTRARQVLAIARGWKRRAAPILTLRSRFRWQSL